MLTALWNGRPRNAHRFGRHLLRLVSRLPDLQREVTFEYNPSNVNTFTNQIMPWRDHKGNLLTEGEIAEKYAYMGELVLDEVEGDVHIPTQVKAARLVGSTVIGPENTEEVRVIVSNVTMMLYHSIMQMGGTRSFLISADEVRNLRRG